MRLQKDILLMLLLSIFYIVGLVGISADASREAYLQLSPFNLLLTLVLFTLAQEKYSSQTLILFFYISLAGFFIEVFGVHTGLIFGNYQYGASLGLQWLNVPLIIGVNWYLLEMACYGIAQGNFDSIWKCSVFASVLATATDALIEPLAHTLDFWHWSGNEIPVQNFVAWFVISMIMQWIIQQFHIHVNKRAAYFVIGLQVVFFTILHLTLR